MKNPRGSGGIILTWGMVGGEGGVFWGGRRPRIYVKITPKNPSLSTRRAGEIPPRARAPGDPCQNRSISRYACQTDNVRRKQLELHVGLTSISIL